MFAGNNIFGPCLISGSSYCAFKAIACTAAHHKVKTRRGNGIISRNTATISRKIKGDINIIFTFLGVLPGAFPIQLSGKQASVGSLHRYGFIFVG